MIRANAGAGVFSFIPPGYDDMKAYIGDLKQAASDNHGVVIRAFLQHLVDDAATDVDELKKELNDWSSEFEQRVRSEDVSGSRARTASTFAMTYAAGKLAQRYGILPKRWACGHSVMYCYLQHILAKSDALGGPVERIKAYASLPGVLTSDNPKKVSVEAFRESAGLVTGQGTSRELWVAPEALRERVEDAVPLVKALRDAGIAVCDQHMLQTKKQIGGRSVRVHAFRLAKR